MSNETQNITRTVSSLGRRKAGIRESIGDAEERVAFVSAQVRMGIPFQIRANRKSRGLSQGELGRATGMKQAAISRLETDSDSVPNINTLLRIAEAFDVGLMVQFVPFNELINSTSGLGSRDLSIPSFHEEAEARNETVTLVTPQMAYTPNVTSDFGTISLGEVRARKQIAPKISKLESTYQSQRSANG